MTITIKNDKRGEYPIDVPLYNRGDCLGIDFNNCKSQILIKGVTKRRAERMIRQLREYISCLDENGKPVQ